MAKPLSLRGDDLRRRAAIGRFRQFFGDTELVGAPAHLGPDFIEGDAAFVPQHDQLVDKIGALADDTARTVTGGSESDFAGLFDQLLRDLAPPAGEQARGLSRSLTRSRAS